jgi:hypothetical protein
MLAAAASIGPPATLVVGPVASLAKELGDASGSSAGSVVGVGARQARNALSEPGRPSSAPGDHGIR